MLIELLKPFFPRAALTSNNLDFWVGHEAQTFRVLRGLLASSNTHYLITGYPGVGKTSFVSNIVSEWRRAAVLQDINQIIIFNLEFAKPQLSEEVVKRIIGKVYFDSLDGQFSPNKLLAERLHLSFSQSYSKSLREFQSDNIIGASGVEAKVKFPGIFSAAASGLKMTLNRKKESSKSLEIQKEYNLNAAITDLESLLHLLSEPRNNITKKWWIFRNKIRWIQPRILFIFDQINDLNIMQELSNLFNIPYASFIVLGGVTLNEQLISQKEKGNDILSSFQEEYIPCQWNDADKILSLIISKTQLDERLFSNYSDYLNFYAQGLPRKVYTAIDKHVYFDKKLKKFYLKLESDDLKMINLCARLHRVLWKNRKHLLGEHIDSAQYYYRDKALRGIYHLTDQIFRVVQFTLQDASIIASQTSDVIINFNREKVLKNLLEIFLMEGLISKTKNIYSLSKDTMKIISDIPNWLNSFLIDDYNLLEQFGTSYDNLATCKIDLSNHSYIRDSVYGSGWSYDFPNSLLEKYLIKRKIGTGGMGEIYLAEDKLLHREIALKLIYLRMGSSLELRNRLLREAKIASSLRHPNIVRVFSFEEIEEQFIIISEYIEGQSLAELLKKVGKLSLCESVKIGIAVADAIRAAHRKSIIHRDVKPSNILIGIDGSIKLTDFGLAKLVEAQDSSRNEITVVGVIMGTPGYMSPEQLDGIQADFRTDFYSLGAVLYEMLTGRQYLESENLFGLMQKIINEIPPSPSKFNASIPKEMDSIIMRCLEKDPAKRFSNINDLIIELKGILCKFDN